MRRWPLLLVLAACKVKDPPAITTEPWSDTFERDSPGSNYYKTGPGYTVTGGALNARMIHNHPMWLRKKLPHDVRIDLDCWSNDSAGDIKVEVFGDGKSFDPDGGAYMATGYEVIFGGWHNAKSIIARMDEHGHDMAERVQPKVVPKQHYHWRIERRGKTMTWWVDDMQTPFLVYEDPRPLEGQGHEYFAFNDWETDTWFDNLVITPI